MSGNWGFPYGAEPKRAETFSSGSYVRLAENYRVEPRGRLWPHRDGCRFVSDRPRAVRRASRERHCGKRKRSAARIARPMTTKARGALSLKLTIVALVVPLLVRSCTKSVAAKLTTAHTSK